ncbi:MAG: serine/threonine protein kinase [Labilithrix sp.]|nr:serine/threonine protein kinase [Labilithrix sp.]
MTVSRIIADRFELVDRIGRGAMGEVWSAIDRTTDSEVALKLVQSWATDERELVARFEREGRLLARIQSPFVCALVDTGRLEDGTPYLALERLVGETLDELLAREGYLALDEVASIADEILQALAVAHAAGIVHRDLSPSNVFLHRRTDGARVTKVLDFGIAKSSEPATQVTANNTTLGSLPFVAPEQLGDSARAGPRADLYAVGAIVFRALTGRLPYGDTRGVPLVALKREHDPPTIDEATGERWPAAMVAFLSKAMARTPADRYASAEAALAALRAAIGGRGPSLELPARALDATTTMDGPPPGARRTR